jgi:hypothetical protein
MIGCPVFVRNRQIIRTVRAGLFHSVHLSRCEARRKCCAEFRLYFHLRRFRGKRNMGLRKACAWRTSGLAVALVLSSVTAIGSRAQSAPGQDQACCATKHDGKREERPSKRAAEAARFGALAETLLAAGPSGKGDWGLLIVDAQTGDTLFEKNADSYFVPASNMKLFTTALALAKLGPDYKFHSGNARHDLDGREAHRRCGAGWARRPESLKP